MAQIIDLHSHTTASDGSLHPEELISLANDRGVDVLAITDHDSIDGLECAQNAAQNLGLFLVSGVEISTRWSGHDIHVVGLGVDTGSDILLEGLYRQKQTRISRAKMIGQRLEKSGFRCALDRAQQIAGRESIGRPHFAQYLMEQGAVKSFDEAFRKFLGTGKSAYVAIEWSSIEEAVQWIKSAGGVAVLAHPGRYRMTRTKLRALIKAFKVWQGDAIEVCTPNHTPEMIAYLSRLTHDFDLMASQGSDFHSPDIPWVELGSMPKMPKECVPVWSKEKRLFGI